MPIKNFSKRVLIFTTAFRPFVGGSEIAIEEIAKRLPDIFFDVITPRYRRSLPALEEHNNVRLHRTGLGWIGDKLWFPIAGFKKARELTSAGNNYEIAHAYQASYGGGAAWFFKTFNPNVKFVLTLQEGKNLEEQFFLIKFFRKLMIKKADAVTVISNYLRNYARKITRWNKISLIPNGVDIENFSRTFSYGELASLKNKLGIKPDKKVLITVSRLVPKNGVDILIDAFKILANKLVSLQACKLIVIGDGPERTYLELQVVDYKLNDDVIFLGSVHNFELPKYLNISDIFIRPSRSEGLGNAFLEAMAAGVPVIATPIGGIPDFLKHKTTGLFSGVDDPKDLAEKIKLLLSDKELRSLIIQNAKTIVVEKYNWQKIAEDFGKIYG